MTGQDARSQAVTPPNDSGVNESLTKPPVQPSIETTEYAAFMRRCLRAHARRCVNGDVEDLAELIQLRAVLDEQIATVVHETRTRHGRSWADIARATGTSRQRAYTKWGRQNG
jgi:hypothetical protein